jgi:hypothetical protein
MKIKLTLGFAVGLMIIAQIGSAQSIFTATVNDATSDNSVIAYVDVTPVPADSATALSSDVVVNDISADDAGSFAYSTSGEDLSSAMAHDISINLADAAPEQDLASDSRQSVSSQPAGDDFATYQSRPDANTVNSSFDSVGGAGWMNFGIATAQQGLMTIDTYVASDPSISSTEADSIPQSSDNSGEAMAGKAPGVGGDLAIPQVPVLPEPSTFGLLGIGGAALVAGALVRQKQTA